MSLKMCLVSSLAAMAASAAGTEPVWPADFAQKLSASIAASTPSGGQVAASADAEEITTVHRGEDASAGYGSVELPFDTFGLFWAYSTPGPLNTIEPQGLYLIVR